MIFHMKPNVLNKNFLSIFVFVNSLIFYHHKTHSNESVKPKSNMFHITAVNEKSVTLFDAFFTFTYCRVGRGGIEASIAKTGCAVLYYIACSVHTS